MNTTVNGPYNGSDPECCEGLEEKNHSNKPDERVRSKDETDGSWDSVWCQNEKNRRDFDSEDETQPIDDDSNRWIGPRVRRRCILVCFRELVEEMF